MEMPTVTMAEMAQIITVAQDQLAEVPEALVVELVFTDGFLVGDLSMPKAAKEDGEA